MFRATRLGFCLAIVGAMAPATMFTPSIAQDAKSEPVPAAPMVNSLKIIFDDKAKNSGQLVFTFTPEGGAAKTISVTIAAKMNRKDVAGSAETELSVALGAGYKVDKYDPDKLKITGIDKAKFSLAISSMTANGLSVRLLQSAPGSPKGS